MNNHDLTEKLQGLPAELLILIACYQKCTLQHQDDIRRFAHACFNAQRSTAPENVIRFPIKISA